jgi:hypothetical protein
LRNLRERNAAHPAGAAPRTEKLYLAARAFNGVSVEEVVEALEEARKLRRERADWEFIEKLPPKLKAALKYYIETGDIYVASRIAGLTVDEFNELRVKARVPSVT